MIRLILIFAILVAVNVLSVNTQNFETRSVAQEKSNDEAPPVRLPIPSQMPDGRRINAIGVYQSQIVGVVPRDYQPVAIDELASAIAQIGNRQANDEDTVLKSSFYDVRLVGDLLVSDLSTIEVQANDFDQALHPLGKVSFALKHGREPSGAGSLDGELDQTMSLICAADGMLIANIPDAQDSKGNETIDFAWELRGQQQGLIQSFDLQIPRTAETRIVLSTPADVVPETADGVLRSLPGPPPGSNIDARGEDVRWHSIEAGGRDRVQIQFRPRLDDSESTPTLIRSQQLSYEIDAGGLKWSHALVVQAPGGSSLPNFQVASGLATSMTVDGVRVRFERIAQDDGMSSIEAEAVLSGSPSTTQTSVVSIAGTMPLNQDDVGWCDLPSVVWNDRRVLLAHRLVEVEVAVLSPLKMIEWELPKSWQQEPSKTINDDANNKSATVTRGSGPPVNSSAEQKSLWSRVRLVDTPTTGAIGSLMQFRIDDDSSQSNRLVSAKAQIDLEVDREQIAPVELQLEPAWNLNSITLLHSGRVIDASSLKNRSRRLTIWPDKEDLLGSQLAIQCDGYRRVATRKSRMVLPEMWFVRVENLRAESTMVIVPPDNLNWSSGTVLEDDRLTTESLSDQDLQFFDAITEDALVYRPQTNTTPRLRLEKPGVLIDVQTSLRFHQHGELIHETFVVDAEATSQQIRQILIQADELTSEQPNNLPHYRWSLISGDAFSGEGIPGDGDASINLPSTAISITKTGQYAIDMVDNSLRGRQLVGRREYALTEPIRIRLPHVVGTASQEAEVIIGDGLQAKTLDASVQRVPLVHAARASEFNSAAGDEQDLEKNTKQNSKQNSKQGRLR